MKPAEFDANNGRLWVNVEMRGLYFVTYTYQLWSASTTEPPVLTNPLKNGNNDSPHDDYYPVVNDYNPTEPLGQHDKRSIEVRLWIKKVSSDDGYRLRITISQGDNYDNAKVIGTDEVEGKVGNAGIKPESLVIKLKRK